MLLGKNEKSAKKALQRWVPAFSGTFNMGVGLVVICPPKDVRRVVEIAHAHGEHAWRCGELVERRAGMKDCELV